MLTNDLRHKLNDRGLSGLQALEACTDLVGDILGAAQVIKDNSLYFVQGTDLLLGDAEITAGELVNLLGSWAASGTAGLESFVGPLGFLNDRLDPSSPHIAPTEWRQELALSAIDLAVEHCLERAWPQSSRRHYKNNYHRTRKP